MDVVKGLLTANAETALTVGGLLIGFVFGALTLKTNFCTMGALSDIVAFGDWRRIRAWLLAIAVSLTGTQVLSAAGAVDLSKSMYLAPHLGWGGNIAGGLLLGFGMVFAGGCPSRNLARAGSGDLRSLITLAMIGITAYMAIGGVLGPVRSAFDTLTSTELDGFRLPSQGVPDVLAALAGKPGSDWSLPVACVLAVSITLYCFVSSEFRKSPMHVVSGIGVGLCIVAGWALTGLAYDDMITKPVPPVSLTFVRPSGDTLDWLQRFTAVGLPGFGVSTVLGALAGAFVTALIGKRLRLQTFANPADTLRNLGGAALMGIGGVMALGCTIGQGITGLSTLAVGSILATVAIVIGGIAGLRVMERLA